MSTSFGWKPTLIGELIALNQLIPENFLKVNKETTFINEDLNILDTVHSKSDEIETLVHEYENFAIQFFETNSAFKKIFKLIIKLLKEKTCTFDIDGIISDYPNCWLKYINIKASTSFTSKDVAKKTIGIDKYNYYKDLYRKSSYKANLPINNGAIETIHQVWEKGYNIVIATSRPFDRYPNLYKPLTIG